MKRTLNEVYRLCQKACEGVGTPAGLDMEAGQNTAWLLARELPALEDLAAALEQLGNAADDRACRFDDDVPAATSVDLDANGKAGALIAPALVDLLVASADEWKARLSVKTLSAPLYLLPAAVRYVNDGFSFCFELNRSDDGRFMLIVDKSGASIFGSDGADVGGLTNNAEFDVVASCAPETDTWSSQTLQFATLISNDTLGAAEARSLAEGVEVIDPESWQPLQAYAARVLVPATEASRQHGAGAGLKDNE
jgi:hypothetical protein